MEGQIITDKNHKNVEKQLKIYGTTVEVKRKYWPKFAKFIENQFMHGGDKYVLEGFDDMEATDLVCKLFEKPGFNEIKWIIKTCFKYFFRFMNFRREKDLFKIATYIFILWLKMGYHLKDEHDEDTRK